MRMKNEPPPEDCFKVPPHLRRSRRLAGKQPTPTPPPSLPPTSPSLSPVGARSINVKPTVRSASSPPASLVPQNAPQAIPKDPLPEDDSDSSSDSYVPIPLPRSTSSFDPDAPVAPNGESTRVQIPFQRLFDELVEPCGHSGALNKTAALVVQTTAWTHALEAYVKVAETRRPGWHSGLRKNRIIDLLNCVVQEAKKLGTDFPFLRELDFGRYEVDGITAYPLPYGRENDWDEYRTPPPGEAWERECLEIVPLYCLPNLTFSLRRKQRTMPWCHQIDLYRTVLYLGSDSGVGRRIQPFFRILPSRVPS